MLKVEKLSEEMKSRCFGKYWAVVEGHPGSMGLIVELASTKDEAEHILKMLEKPKDKLINEHLWGTNED